MTICTLYLSQVSSCFAEWYSWRWSIGQNILERLNIYVFVWSAPCWLYCLIRLECMVMLYFRKRFSVFSPSRNVQKPRFWTRLPSPWTWWSDQWSGIISWGGKTFVTSTLWERRWGSFCLVLRNEYGFQRQSDDKFYIHVTVHRNKFLFNKIN